MPGEGNGTPLQYSCLENPMDGGAWWAAFHGVVKSWTRLSDFTFTHWRRKWQPTPVFLPGESQGLGSLVGCCLWARRVGHDWSDLAAAAAAARFCQSKSLSFYLFFLFHKGPSKGKLVHKSPLFSFFPPLILHFPHLRYFVSWKLIYYFLAHSKRTKVSVSTISKRSVVPSYFTSTFFGKTRGKASFSGRNVEETCIRVQIWLS